MMNCVTVFSVRRVLIRLFEYSVYIPFDSMTMCVCAIMFTCPIYQQVNLTQILQTKSIPRV